MNDTRHRTAQDIRGLCSQLRKKITRLRDYYGVANSSQHRRPADEWLCDNYYVLERETKQSIRDMRQLAARFGGEGLCGLFTRLDKAIRRDMPAVTDETLAALIEEIQKDVLLGEAQFKFLSAAVRASLVGIAYSACLEDGGEREIAYAVTGLSRFGAIDFERIVQSCSGVEQVLRNDPAGVYTRMSDESRQHYRHLVAKIARAGRVAEKTAAERLLGASLKERDPAKRHIGYAITTHAHVLGPRRRRGITALLLSALLPLGLCILAAIITRNVWMVFLCYLPFWEILRTPVQQIAQAGVEVDFIPRMDLKKVTDKPKTVVLVSTLLASGAEELEKRLLQLYFSNSDPDMYYCILADLKEWDFPSDEKDESLVAAAKAVVDSLNERHNNRFMLFLRGRAYNRSRKKYSGWERKRGAITEFIRFLKSEGASVHTFVGDRSVLGQIRYILALDADTNLHYESAQTLVSAAIHPLNRPVIGEDNIVVAGYGILTPKMSADLGSAKATAFSRVISGCGGVTAYDTRDREFYQDLFGESVFAGKGLIDIDCFYRVLNDRFPENRVLSHDILEGAYLRAGFVSDVEMTDQTPSSMISWLSRLHRWIRGDWQNIGFTAQSYRADGKVYKNPIRILARYQLLDNLRRPLTPVAALVCLSAAIFSPPLQALLLLLAGVLSVTLASLWSAVWSLFTGGFFTLSRKFFTRTLPHTLELLGQAALFLIMLPAQAIGAVDAIVRSLWRLNVSRRNLLEWTTAAQADTRRPTVRAFVRRFFWPELLGLLYLLASGHNAFTLVGIAFALVMPVAWYTARPTEEDGHALSGQDRDELISYCAAMWRYYEDFADERNNFLPPDNIQQSPVFRVATRTSPTNIGMMLLSALAARDLGLIDTEGLCERLERTISSVEKLATWRGNLINWYDTETLDTLKPEFVSTVDSGNFICCLVALGQGLAEFRAEQPALGGLIRRVEALVERADLTAFYDSRKKLFSIGWDMDSGKLVDSHYDFLMSEARLTSYFAVARKLVGKKHWGALNRTMSRAGSYAGAVSWTGTMFEYYMPHLLLPIFDGSLLGEALTYCLYCHKRRVGRDMPWGISESAFWAFDNNLNYQYKAHGVQKLGVKRYLDLELVISPYSTFITISHNPNSSMRNLRRLRELGVYGRYGFFEAVDFTGSRVGAGGLAVVRSYMAHHIGMSMVASCNALFDNRMQRRFMRDNYMRSAAEFLQEKIAKNTVVYDELKNQESRAEKHERPKIREGKRGVFPQNPVVTLLTNGEITDVLTDTGAGYLKFGAVDLTRRSDDLLRRAQGLFVIARVQNESIPATSAPFYDRTVQYSFDSDESSLTWYARKKNTEIGLRCMIHPTISCVQRQIVIKNNGPQKQLVQVLCYFEPVLCGYRDYSAHPAYSKLFVGAKYDSQNKILVFSRRNRDGSQDMFLAVGFLQDIGFSFETSRENLMRAPNGYADLLNFHKTEFSNGGAGVPDACCALRFDMTVPSGGQDQASLLFAAARSEQEGVAAIISVRKAGGVDPKNAARSPVQGDTLEGRLASRILGELLFRQAGCVPYRAERQENRLGQSSLWCTGISGDLPIALFEMPADFDELAPKSCLRLHSSLRGLHVQFDLCMICESEADRLRLEELACKNGARLLLGKRGGVFLLRRDALAPETITLLRAACRHAGPQLRSEPERRPFIPAEFRAVSPVQPPGGDVLAVHGGVFENGRFWADRTTPLPYTHILANPVFGTLVSDTALGFTWAVNSRENKLTPWYNDICTDNLGEMCVLCDGESFFDLVRGSRADFADNEARYQGKTTKLSTSLSVTVSPKGCAKHIEAEIVNRTDKPREIQLAYYIEPVLAVNRDTSQFVIAEAAGDALLLHNPWNSAVRCFAALSFRAEPSGIPVYLSDRAAFLSGDWGASCLEPQNDPCAAVILPLEIPPKGAVKASFALSYGSTRESALAMAGPQARSKAAGSFVITTPDKYLDAYINGFAPHQIVQGRIWGRCGFYQCGGAWGFRDQLQDSAAALLFAPKIARRQIARCCAVQFEQGDVLHWWHCLPKNAGGLKGVRTRFSDDLVWLPLTVCEYVEKTGDESLLDLQIAYISAPELEASEHEKYISPARSELKESVFRHCARALERAHRLGENGLPLIGCGDWNDGFSSVGLCGRGTSCWLAMFLAITLDKFSKLCRGRGEQELEALCRERAAALRAAVDACGWDGEWYLRAFFDNGDKIGSRDSQECRIDLLPQSFAVFAGMPDKERVDTAMRAALERLVDNELRLVRLFENPFADGPQRPGYIKAYPKGIRENGGQYTHAAVWFAMALLEHGNNDEGFSILQMLNPADRSSNAELAAAYKLEPYYIPADVYTNPHAPGRGGWSLYTGASSWYFRAVIEHVLGVRLRGGYVELVPKLPSGWQFAEIDCVISGTRIKIRYTRGAGADPPPKIPLDGGEHEIEFRI